MKIPPSLLIIACGGEGALWYYAIFLQCPRAYHQACVMPTFPTKLDAHPSNADLDDPLSLSSALLLYVQRVRDDEHRLEILTFASSLGRQDPL